MEEKNKLVSEMEIAKKGGSVATIAAIVQKYCPQMQIDAEFLKAFSEVLSGYHSDMFAYEREFDRVSDLFPPNFDRQDELTDSMAETTKLMKEKAGSPEIIDAMAKAKYVLSLIVYKECQCSEKESLLEQQLLDIRESYRLDEFDPTSDDRLDQEAMESHPNYRDIKAQLYKTEELEQMFGHDRTLLDAAIKMFERESTLSHNSYDWRERYELWPEYEKGVQERVQQIEEMIRQQQMQKGGKK